MSKSPLTFRIFKAGTLVREETLALGVIKLGKVPSAHLRLDDESVSRMHAIIEVDAAGSIHLIDLGSTRGTFVNGTKINKAKIAHGDVIEVGDTRIELSVGAPAAAVIAAPLPVAPPPAPAPMLRAVPLVAPAPAFAPVAPPPLPVAPRATPAPALFAATAASPAQIAAALATSTDEPGARAVEVAAMLGDSVVEVKHCMDPHGGKITRTTYGLLGASLVCALAAAGSFAAGVNVAARNKTALEYWTHTAKKPAHSFRAEQTSGALDFLQFGGLALAIGTAAAGLGRARRERRSPYFRIGTAPGVELATESAPSASFPLVAPSGDDFVFNFAAGMDGEMIVAGTSTPFAELAASGRARPSATVAGALELPIPADAKIRARAGASTFLVSAVAKPRTQAAPLFVLDSRAAMYAAASLVVHLGLYGLASLGTADAATIGIDIDDKNDLGIVSTSIDHEVKPDKPDPSDTGDNNDKSTTGGGRMALPEGAAGNPNAAKPDGHMEVADNHQDHPMISRQEAIAYAQSAGVLGDTRALDSAMSAFRGPDSISNGFDNANIYGPLFGGSGEGQGTFGMGRNGTGIGGGCLSDCGGVGSGRYHTIGPGGDGPGGWGPGHGRGTGLGPRTSLIPPVTIPQPNAVGDLDKSIIKRYVKRQQEKIAYCYEHELMAHGGIQGDVVVQFFIAPDGSVQSSKGTGFNPEVASCVADVVHAINFPAPKDGGGVTVNYPFHFHTPSAQ